MTKPKPLGPALTDGGPGDLRSDSTVVTVRAGDIPSSIPRCIAPDDPVTAAALKMYFALDSVHRNLPDRTASYAGAVGEALNEAHYALWGNGRDA